MPLADKLLGNVVFHLRQLGEVMLSPSSAFSVWSLASALGLAVAVILLRRRGRRIPRLRVWLRALFPRRIVRSASSKADFGFFLLNLFAAGALVGWAALTGVQVGSFVKHGLTALFGAPGPSTLPALAIHGAAMTALFVAYELAYWLDHYTSHKIPFFWAFHKVHHTAEVLTPLTNFRLHPVDALKFGNISAVIGGGMAGLLAWGFGGAADRYLFNGANLILLVFIYTVVHLQHSHVWIAVTGGWARVIMSPAHHQIHHSDNPVHFDRNFGSTLSVWDWLAGTLYIPSAKRERIAFGAGGEAARPHSVTDTLLAPFAEAAASLAITPAKPRAVATPLAPRSPGDAHTPGSLLRRFPPLQSR